MHFARGPAAHLDAEAHEVDRVARDLEALLFKISAIPSAEAAATRPEAAAPPGTLPARRQTPAGGEARPPASPVWPLTKADHFRPSTFFRIIAACAGVSASASCRARLRTLSHTVLEATPGTAAAAAAAAPNWLLARNAARCAGDARSNAAIEASRCRAKAASPTGAPLLAWRLAFWTAERGVPLSRRSLYGARPRGAGRASIKPRRYRAHDATSAVAGAAGQFAEAARRALAGGASSTIIVSSKVVSSSDARSLVRWRRTTAKRRSKFEVLDLLRHKASTMSRACPNSGNSADARAQADRTSHPLVWCVCARCKSFKSSSTAPGLRPRASRTFSNCCRAVLAAALAADAAAGAAEAAEGAAKGDGRRNALRACSMVDSARYTAA